MDANQNFKFTRPYQIDYQGLLLKPSSIKNRRFFQVHFGGNDMRAKMLVYLRRILGISFSNKQSFDLVDHIIKTRVPYNIRILFSKKKS